MLLASLIYAVCISAPSCLNLVVYDVIKYNVVMSAADSYESIKDVHFTDV